MSSYTQYFKDFRSRYKGDVDTFEKDKPTTLLLKLAKWYKFEYIIQ